MIIDTPTDLEKYAKALVAAGVTTAIRYESRLPNAGWKRWQPDEMKAFQAAGLHCGIVYEDGARQFGYENGVAAATYALERCKARGQSSGAIYYAEDFDASVADLNGPIVDFFHGVNAVHKKLKPNIRIGCYGSGMVNRTLLAVKLIDLRWITCSTSFNGSARAIHDGAYELWQTRCDTSLHHLDVDFNVARVNDFGQFMPFEPAFPVFPSAAPVTFAALQPSPAVPLEHGKGSWYSQFHGLYNWHDPVDRPDSNALGVPDDCQGVSFNHGPPGHWYEVHFPNGRVSVEQQTDVGPSPATGRKIDISAVCAERNGYSPQTFPTNGMFYWRPVPPPWQVASLSPRQQAKQWLKIRQVTA